MDNDEKYMALALREAAKGQGRTSPNPCVGAVIVRDGRILATGYHQKAGTPHAERNAIAAAKESLRGATLYVTLEPCSHTGRTPPCCEAVIEHRFGRVVVGMADPNPLVNGKGLAWLRRAGIEVCCGVLESECRRLNRPFLKHITTGRPWTIMKAGVSLDGRLNYRKGESGWITGPESLRMVHTLRDQVDAIMVGSGTVLVDNPSLTTRLDGEGGHDPVRIVLDSTLRIPTDAKIYHLDSLAETIVFCGTDATVDRRRSLAALGVESIVVSLDESGKLVLGEVLDQLGKRQLCSVLVEGGSTLHGAMLRGNLYDEACLFYAPLFAGDGGVSLAGGLQVGGEKQALRLEKTVMEQFGADWMIRGEFAGRELIFTDRERISAGSPFIAP